jgi:hypothetical protein
MVEAKPGANEGADMTPSEIRTTNDSIRFPNEETRRESTTPRQNFAHVATVSALAMSFSISAGISAAIDDMHAISPAVPAPIQIASAPIERPHYSHAFQDAAVAQSDAIFLAQVEIPSARAGDGLVAPRTAPNSGSGDSLVAALSEMPPPSYVSPATPQNAGWNRTFGAVRSGKLGTRVEAVAPGNHTGLSFSASPRLWWRLDGPTEYAIQLTIVDDNAIDPVLRIEIPGPHPAGLNAIDLSQKHLALETGVDYRWFVALVVDPERPSRNPVSEGSIRVVEDSDARRGSVASADSASRGHSLAEQGIWYDAYDFFSTMADEHPEAPAISRHRDSLLEVARSE